MLSKKTAFYGEHNSQFALFEDSQKWNLKRGRKVEDIFHEFALISTNENAAHSFTMNQLDSTWLQLDAFDRGRIGTKFLRTTVIAYGSGNFNSSSPGYKPSPMRASQVQQTSITSKRSDRIY
jgi:hypothetical protein